MAHHIHNYNIMFTWINKEKAAQQNAKKKKKNYMRVCVCVSVCIYFLHFQKNGYSNFTAFPKTEFV